MPLFLVNARLSERSARGYARVPALTRPMFAALAGVAAQTAADAARLAALGAPRVGGHRQPEVRRRDARTARKRSAAELRARFGAARPVWVAASTRDGEEALLLDALAAARAAAQAR